MRAFTKRAAGLSLAALPLGLAACASAGMSVTHTTFYDYRYYPRQVAAHGAPMPVELRGAPRDAADLVPLIRLPAHIGRQTTLAAAGETGPRLVIAFARASGKALCAPGGGPEGATTAPTLSGAYCVGDIPFSSAITEGGGGGDAGFAEAASHLTRVLLPTFNPEHRRIQFDD